MDGMAESRLSHNGTQSADELSAALDASKAPAISRAAAILRLLGDSPTPLGVNRIARELGIISSTCLHILRALVSAELVAVDPGTKLYSLDVGLLTLSRHWLASNRFNELVQPELDRLSQDFHVSAIGLEIVRLDYATVVAVSQPSSDLQLTFAIGSRIPALQGGIGRCIAAFGGHADADLEARFNAADWEARPTFAEWKSHVSQTRAKGLAIETGHFIAGITTISAPIWNSRQELSHILTVAALRSLKGQALNDLQTTVLESAKVVTSQLQQGFE